MENPGAAVSTDLWLQMIDGRRINYIWISEREYERAKECFTSRLKARVERVKGANKEMEKSPELKYV